MQSPSSLIFLVLLGVWAAYFVQYWVRRRDHVATARSVEQFSTAMRVLERRAALPATDLSEAAPRSYAVHPARSARPQVMVKRAVAAESPAPGTVTERIEAPAGPARVAAPSPSIRPAAARRVPAPVARPRVRPSRRVRGLLLLAALAELVAIGVLVGFSLLPLWALAPGVLAVAAAVAFVRSGVRLEGALVRAQRRRSRELERLRSTAPVAAPTVARTAVRPAAAVEEPVVVTGAVVEPTETVAAASVRVAAQTFDEVVAAVAEPVVVEPVAAGPAVMVPIEVDDDIPLTWDPVPVPRPTYTMKAKAERPEVPPAAVTPDPAPVVRAVEDDTAYEQRRVAGA